MKTAKQFNLEKYMSDGVERIVSGIVKASLHNPKAALLMMKHAAYSAKARKIREKAEQEGNHIPPFLIASITNHCNLHCSGCYARAEGGFCTDGSGNGDSTFAGEATGKESNNMDNNNTAEETDAKKIMTEEQWDSIFMQSEEMGIEFILLAGGEPLLREDVIRVAGKHNNILFPVFTNGTLLTDGCTELLKENRNLMPVISIEGSEKATDNRRGTGVYGAIDKAMQNLLSAGIIFGVSITVTKQNMDEVYSTEFVDRLESKGVKAIIYVEYVPVECISEAGSTDNRNTVDDGGKVLAVDDDDREVINKKLLELRTRESQMLLISFPGDEKSSGGCLAAGRGFFHINPYGGAEPCPFSPYSDTNVKDVPLTEALKSPLFVGLQESGALMEEHVGGCTLFGNENVVNFPTIKK